ncbi:transposase [Burkholderia ambifaria]|nr:transposase [Burkholderia ambifaria]MDR6503946.1 transposase [Burkholderia ambifaria]
MPYKAKLKSGAPRKRPKPTYRVTNARAYNASLKRRGQPLLSGRGPERGVVQKPPILGNTDSGCPWAEMPADYPPYQTCHRHFKKWRDSGVLEQVLTMLYREKRHVLLPAIQ